MEAITNIDFQTGTQTLLSFRREETLKIMERQHDDPHWYFAQSYGKSGLVAENMIEILPNTWYYGKCSRTSAEIILSEKPEIQFLIRRANETLFLSYRLRNTNSTNIWHFKITKHANDQFSFFSDNHGLREFFSLNQLANYVERHGWYSCCWWTPFFDIEPGEQRMSLRKRTRWTPNV